jgi:hypothetical protein
VPIHRVNPRVAFAVAAALALASSSLAQRRSPPSRRRPETRRRDGSRRRLAKACERALRRVLLGDERARIDRGSQARESYRLKYILRRIEESTKQLAGALAAGKGRDETTPEVEDIGILARDARVQLARMFVQSPLQARIDTARDLWRQLLPYYGLTPPPEQP